MRIVEREWATHEVAESIRDRQHWVVGSTPQTIERVACTIEELWPEADTYLDSGTPLILVGTPVTARATQRLMPALEALGQSDVCAIFVISKRDVSSSELNASFARIDGTQIPDDDSQDIILFAEPLEGEVSVGYMPTLLLDAANEVDRG